MNVMWSQEQRQIAARELTIVAVLLAFCWLGGMYVFAPFSFGFGVFYSLLGPLFLYLLRWVIWGVLHVEADAAKEGLLFACCAIGTFFLINCLFLVLVVGLRLTGVKVVVGGGIGAVSIALRGVIGSALVWWSWPSLRRQYGRTSEQTGPRTE